VAVGLPLAQGIGRWGNYFNQELYGRPTHLPWALHIDPAHRLPQFANVALYQPTFLYESIWDIGTAIALILLDRKYKLGHGRVFALYLVIYGIGRSWIEALRIDPAHHFYGLRLNDWTSIAIVVAGVIAYLVSARLHPGREVVLVRGAAAEDASVEPATDTATSATAEVTETTDVTEPTDVLEPDAPPGEVEETDAQPATAAEPVDALDPAMDVALLFRPVRATEPEADAEMAEVGEPVADADMAEVVEPAAEPQPETADEAEPADDEPEPAEDAAPADEAAAEDEAAAADEAEPADEAAPADETEPGDEAASSDESVDEVAVGADPPVSHGGES
jgi:hypothetical protein